MAADPGCYGYVIARWAATPCCPLNRPLHGWWAFRLGLLVVPSGVQTRKAVQSWAEMEVRVGAIWEAALHEAQPMPRLSLLPPCLVKPDLM